MMESRLTRWASPLLVTAGVVILLVVAVFLVNREEASSVARSAEIAMVADNSLGAATTIYSATAYAAAFELVTTGNPLTTEVFGDLALAMVDLQERVDRLTRLLDQDTADLLDTDLQKFLKATTTVSDAIQTEGADVSAALVDQTATMAALGDELVQIRDRSVESVLLAGEDVGRAATVVRFLVLFVIPLGVIVSLWRIQRRRVEKRILASEVEKQRQVARSKDAFVADVSHELRTPLTGIYGFSIALEESSDNLTEFQTELLSLIISESTELSRMVDDLVAIGRLNAGVVTYVMEEVDVSEVADQIIKVFQRLEISFENDCVGQTVYADETRFRQILRNLVSNAVRYGNGEIAVTARTNQFTTTIEVVDNGPGVPDEVASRLFQRYAHTEGSGVIEGSVGLGLAIARSFAEGMGGRIGYARHGDRSAFQLELPTHRSLDDHVEAPVISIPA